MADEGKKRTEEELIAQAQGGDSEATSALLEKYKERVRMLSRPLFLMDGDRDDLLQEGMIGLFNAIRTYDATRGASFETFANRCILSQMYTAVKASNRKKNIPLNSAVSLDSASDTDDDTADKFFLQYRVSTAGQLNPEEIVIGKESANDIQRELERVLSPMEKQVLHLFLQGLSYREIAQKMEKQPKAIDNALQRIKAKLAAVEI